MVGLPAHGLSAWTLLFLLLGPWGAAIGLFAGHVLDGQPLGRSFAWLGVLLLLAPIAVALLTAVFSTPMFLLLRYLDASISQILLLVITWWYLLSAATGVEMLDRQLR